MSSSHRGLSAGGATNTGSGLIEALDELERNGWENRSSTIILLADGHTNRGPDPVGIAEDAATDGVEISTIGLGSGIDEAELREIAAVTGGDFYHVEDAEDLPETFERVAENQTGPELRDTNGDGIPDVVAEMDLRMPTGEPGVVGEPLELDPLAIDTSADGLLDNETVVIEYRLFEENDEPKLEAQVTYAEHHPARINTTGDELTDREQLEGWEIQVVDDHDNATALMTAVLDPDDDADPAQLFETRTVGANPLVTDTSGDGLSDEAERELGTDPRTTDTTDDGIADAVALSLDSEDPTVFTTTPPDARLVDYQQWSELPSATWDPGLEFPDVDGPKWYFQYTFVVEDEAGVAEYEVVREGTTIASGHPYDTHHFDTATYESLWEGSMTALRGSESTIYVEDVHENGQQQLLYAQTSFYGELTAYGFPAQDAGQLSGFTHGASELPEFVHLVVTEPVETYEAFEAFLEEVDDELLAELIANMPESVREQQRLDNPYTDGSEPCDAGDTRCAEYAQGWYEGYVAHFAASMAYGGTITKGVSESTGLANRLETARRGLDDVTPTLRISDGTKTGQVTHRLVADGGSPDIDAPAVTRHLREDHGFETAGGVNGALDTITELRHVGDLTSSEQAALAARLSKSSDPSAARAFVTELDDVGDVRVLLDQDQTTVNRLVDWHANPGSYRHIDSDLEASDFIGVVKNNGNPAETRLVTKDPEGNLVWLENGDSGSGWVHIRDGHRDDFRSEFPSVRDGELTIHDLIYEAAKNPHRTEPNPGGGIRYYDVVDGSEIRVATGDNGYIISAHPDT